MAAKITIRWTVPLSYRPGDYAKLFGNGGSGDIDWDTPIDNKIYPLFPSGAGNYGFGHAPFGHHRFGHLYSTKTLGFGHGPFGHGPFGCGVVTLEAVVRVEGCGAYKFAFGCFDKFGNPHEGTPEEITVNIHIAPPSPARLKKYSYNKTTGELVLTAA